MYGITFVRLEYRAPMPDRLMGKDSNLDPREALLVRSCHPEFLSECFVGITLTMNQSTQVRFLPALERELPWRGDKSLYAFCRSYGE